MIRKKIIETVDKVSLWFLGALLSIKVSMMTAIWNVSGAAADNATNDALTPMLRQWSWPIFIVAFLWWWFGNEKSRPIAKRFCIGAVIAFAIGVGKGLWEGTITGIASFFGMS